jgi:N-acetylglutamate synthase-like GNAT family acetyltransferase
LKFTLRSATQSDQGSIRRLIRLVRINPTGLDWRRFVVAVSVTGEIIGCGQVKTHSDRSHELASIAVLPEYRGEGVASAIIEHLINISPKPLYLTCRANLESFYLRFGFHTIQESEMPHYFQRLSRVVKVILFLSRKKEALLVMQY